MSEVFDQILTVRHLACSASTRTPGGSRALLNPQYCCVPAVLKVLRNGMRDDWHIFWLILNRSEPSCYRLTDPFINIWYFLNLFCAPLDKYNKVSWIQWFVHSGLLTDLQYPDIRISQRICPLNCRQSYTGQDMHTFIWWYGTVWLDTTWVQLYTSLHSLYNGV